MKVLFILSNILGHATFSKQVVDIVSTSNEFKHLISDYMYFNTCDYSVYRDWSRYNIWKNKFETAYTMKNKLSTIDIEKYDRIFVVGWEIMYALNKYVDSSRIIISTDTTDLLSHMLVANQNNTFVNKFKCKIKDIITYGVYSNIVKNIYKLVSYSRWCADSLVYDYKVTEEKIVIMPGGVDLELWKPLPSAKDNKELLFVGNDFIRKGGDLLIELYRQGFSKFANLTIVSNDVVFEKLELPPGVRLVSGITHDRVSDLIKIYQSSDIFVLPTRNDKLGHVLKEAAAVGLALVATDVGAISEVVEDNYNGKLIKLNCSLSELRDVLLSILNDPIKLNEYKSNSRKIAEERFSLDLMRQQLLSALE